MILWVNLTISFKSNKNTVFIMYNDKMNIFDIFVYLLNY